MKYNFMISIKISDSPEGYLIYVLSYLYMLDARNKSGYNATGGKLVGAINSPLIFIYLLLLSRKSTVTQSSYVTRPYYHVNNNK